MNKDILVRKFNELLPDFYEYHPSGEATQTLEDWLKDNIQYLPNKIIQDIVKEMKRMIKMGKENF